MVRPVTVTDDEMMDRLFSSGLAMKDLFGCAPEAPQSFVPLSQVACERLS